MPSDHDYFCRFRLSALILLVSVLFLAGCSKSDQEQAVNKLVEEAVAMAEAHNLGGIMDLTGEQFSAGPGNHSRKEVRRVLFVMLKRYGRFRIHYPQPSVKLSDDERRAIVKMNFMIANKDEIFPDLKQLYTDTSAWVAALDENADLYTLSLELNYDSGDWLVTRAKITRFGRPHGTLR